jgi:hypothetical protein
MLGSSPVWLRYFVLYFRFDELECNIFGGNSSLWPIPLANYDVSDEFYS